MGRGKAKAVWAYVKDRRVYKNMQEACIENGLSATRIGQLACKRKDGFRKVMRVFRVARGSGEVVDCVRCNACWLMPVDRETAPFMAKEAERIDDVTEEYVAQYLQAGVKGDRWMYVEKNSR